MVRYLILTLILAFYSSVNAFEGSSFLSQEECVKESFKEYKIGEQLARDRDYSRAIHAFSRALALCPKNFKDVQEIEYAIVFTHYLNKDYEKVIEFFETHSLLYTNEQFSHYHDLMILLHHSYEILKKTDKADLILKRLEAIPSEDLVKSRLYSALLRRDFKAIETYATHENKEWMLKLSQELFKNEKSKKLARVLNIIVPGMGYLYLGQKKTALSAFVLNTCLIFGTVQLFYQRYYTLGALTLFFEMGWYVGGIVGSAKASDQYNDALFSNYAEKVFFYENLDPNQQLKYAF